MGLATIFIDLAQPHTHTHTLILVPVVDVALLHTLRAALEGPTGHTLAGPRTPAASLAQRVANVTLVLWNSHKQRERPSVTMQFFCCEICSDGKRFTKEAELKRLTFKSIDLHSTARPHEVSLHTHKHVWLCVSAFRYETFTAPIDFCGKTINTIASRSR